MREPKRIDRILKLVKKHWKRVPDQRLGQFLENYVFGECVDTFYQEDDVTEDRLLVLSRKEKG